MTYFSYPRLVGTCIFVMVDETCDMAGTAVAAVLGVPLDGEFQDRACFRELMDTNAKNNEISQQAVQGALQKALSYDKDSRKVRLLFITDDPHYCLMAGRGLNDIFPNVVRITCLCHRLHCE